MVGVDIRDNLDQARIYRDEFKMRHLAYTYQVDSPPSSLFIDRNGIIAFKITGGLGIETYKRIIEDKLLKPAR